MTLPRLGSPLGLPPMFAFMFAAACGGGDERSSADQRVELPPPPANGMRLLVPEVSFPPGQDRQICVYTTLQNDEPLWIRGFSSHQGPAGHHLVAFTTLEDEPDGTMIDCSSPDRMPYWRLLFAPKKRGDDFELAPGYAIKVEPRAKVVMQLHYVNATRQPMITRDALDLEIYEGAEEPISVAPFVVGSASFEIPPRQRFTGTYECDVQEDINVTLALGHMHEHGRSLELVTGSPGSLHPMYAVEEWRPEYRDQAPVTEWPIDDPLKMRAGDVVRVSCTWESNTDEPLVFPKEMCAAVFWFHPARAPVTCPGRNVE